MMKFFENFLIINFLASIKILALSLLLTLSNVFAENPVATVQTRFFSSHDEQYTSDYQLHVKDITDNSAGEPFMLNIKVVIEGPYTPDQDKLMQTTLRDNGLLPFVQPFRPNLPYFGNTLPQWYYTGNEFAQLIPPDAVDWVLIELRDAPVAGEAFFGTRIARKAAFLLSDGLVIFTTGELPVFDVAIQSGLFVIIYHRNHLAVMSSGPLEKNGNIYSWDFTGAQHMAFEDGLKNLNDGIFAMFGGDGDANGQVQNQDKNNVWSKQSGQNGYLAGDFDLNGQVQTQDKNNIWSANSGIASQVPGAGQGRPCPGIPEVTDSRDGQVYQTVLIGEQCWLKKNLRYLPEVFPGTQRSAELPRYYVYSYSGNSVSDALQSDNFANYGVLYNWPAASSACPAGWRLSTENDWSKLSQYLSSTFENINSSNVANALKSCRQVNSSQGPSCQVTQHPRWNSDIQHHGIDLFGFFALPGGLLQGNGLFGLQGSDGIWWSEDNEDGVFAERRQIASYSGGIAGGALNKELGLSVRCIRSEEK